MADAFCTILFLGFFGILIYSIMTQPKKAPPVAAPPTPTPSQPTPGMVGLCCLACYATVRMVDHAEYLEITKAGRRIYCTRCLTAIETNKREQARG